MWKNQISQATSSPTSKTRKPTMNIHPSVDIAFDGTAVVAAPPECLHEGYGASAPPETALADPRAALLATAAALLLCLAFLTGLVGFGSGM